VIVSEEFETAGRASVTVSPSSKRCRLDASCSVGLSVGLLSFVPIYLNQYQSLKSVFPGVGGNRLQKPQALIKSTPYTQLRMPPVTEEEMIENFIHSRLDNGVSSSEVPRLLGELHGELGRGGREFTETVAMVNQAVESYSD
jgi:hypothetical protein